MNRLLQTATYAVVVAVLIPSPGVTKSPEASITFATKIIGSWNAEAVLQTEPNNGTPRLTGMQCLVETPGFKLFVMHDGEILPRFSVVEHSKDTGQDLHLSVNKITIDNEVNYEAKAIGISRFPQRGTFRYLGVRSSPHSPWLMVTALVSEMMSSRKTRFRYSPHPEGVSGDAKWTTVRLDRMREVVKWCQDAMASEKALRHRPDEKN